MSPKIDTTTVQSRKTDTSNGEEDLEYVKVYSFEQIKSMTPIEIGGISYVKDSVSFEDLTNWKLEELSIDQLYKFFEFIKFYGYFREEIKEGVTLQSFTPEQLKKLFETLDDKGLDTIDIFVKYFSPKQLEVLSPEQINTLSWVLKPEQFSGLSAEDLFYDDLLHTIECDEIKYIRPDVVKEVVQIYKVFSTDHSDVHCLTREQITALTPQEVAWIIQYFTKEQLSWITPEYIAAIPTFKDEWQGRPFSKIGKDWINNLSEEQLLALSPEQKKIIYRFKDTETKRLAHFIEYNNHAKKLYELRVQGKDLFKNEEVILSDLKKDFLLWMLDPEQYESMSLAQVSSIHPFEVGFFSSRRIKHIPHLIKLLKPVHSYDTIELLGEEFVSSIAPEQFIDLTEEQLEAMVQQQNVLNWITPEQFISLTEEQLEAIEQQHNVISWITPEQFSYIPYDVFQSKYEDIYFLMKPEQFSLLNEEKIMYCIRVMLEKKDRRYSYPRRKSILKRKEELDQLKDHNY